MSEPLPHPRRIVHLVIDGCPAAEIATIAESSPANAGVTEVFPLTPAHAREALDLIFSSDTVAVWGKL